MKTKTRILLSSLLSVTTLSVTGSAFADESSSLRLSVSEGRAHAVSVSKDEQELVARIHMFNRHVTHLSQLAIHQSQSPMIRDLARKLAQDHMMLEDELVRMAHSRQIFPGQIVTNLPDTAQIRQSHRDLMTRLGKLKDSAFDQLYLETMVRLHSAEEERLNALPVGIVDSDLRLYVERLRPMMKDHLEQSRTLLAEQGAGM
jgi:predicted outer membrane protein